MDKALLRDFDQLHLPVFGAVQDHDFPLWIAEDEDIAVLEMGFLDRFFESHGAHGDRIIGANQVNFGGFCDRGIFVNQHWHRRLFR